MSSANNNIQLRPSSPPKGIGHFFLTELKARIILCHQLFPLQHTFCFHAPCYIFQSMPELTLSHHPHSGVVKLLHFPLHSGTAVVVMPRFDPIAFCTHIEKYKVTIALVVPPMLLVIARHPGQSVLLRG